MRIAVVTDSWKPTTGGVVTLIEGYVNAFESLGHTIDLIEPETHPGFRIRPLVAASRVSVPNVLTVERLRAADLIFTQSEGPLCSWVRASAVPFVSYYHTKVPEYLDERLALNPLLTWQFIRWFHGASRCVFTPSEKIARQLRTEANLRSVVVAPYGVDLAHFSPGPRLPNTWPRPILLYVGRLEEPKGVGEFLATKLPGTKVLVGTGVDEKRYRVQYPDAVFVGVKKGQELVDLYRTADVFVFPSIIDTFGLVQLEALACGTPVVAREDLGIVTSSCGHVGDLKRGVLHCLRTVKRDDCRARALAFTWDKAARRILRAIGGRTGSFAEWADDLAYDLLHGGQS